MRQEGHPQRHRVQRGIRGDERRQGARRRSRECRAQARSHAHRPELPGPVVGPQQGDADLQPGGDEPRADAARAYRHRQPERRAGWGAREGPARQRARLLVHGQRGQRNGVRRRRCAELARRAGRRARRCAVHRGPRPCRAPVADRRARTQARCPDHPSEGRTLRSRPIGDGIAYGQDRIVVRCLRGCAAAGRHRGAQQPCRVPGRRRSAVRSCRIPARAATRRAAFPW